MTHRLVARSLAVPLAAACLISAPLAASAQGMSRPAGWSMLPGTTSGYVGLNIGRSDYDDFPCGIGFGCDDSATRWNVYTGGLVNQWFGVELGYINEGSVGRAGGNTRAQGVNLSLVGRLPVDMFSVYGKIGALYGRTRVRGSSLSLIDTGSESGWGSTLAVGASWDFMRNGSVVLELSRDRFKVPGGSSDNVEGLSLGYVHRF